METKDILFSVNEYDKDGNKPEDGIFLHFGSTRVLAATSIEDFREIIGHFENMIEEIETAYADEIAAWSAAAPSEGEKK